MQIHQRLFLRENGLGHDVGRIGLFTNFIADKAFGFRVARRVFSLFQAIKNAVNHVIFLLIHTVSAKKYC